MKTVGLTLCVLGIWLAVSGFSSQPLDERKAQEALPQSKDPMWDKLTKTKISFEEKAGLYSATYPAEIKAMEGKPMTINGFMLPLEPTETFNHFILSKRPPTCPYCPPGEPNEIVEIFTTKATKWRDEAITVSGTFGFTNQQELGMFFTLKNATIK